MLYQNILNECLLKIEQLKNNNYFANVCNDINKIFNENNINVTNDDDNKKTLDKLFTTLRYWCQVDYIYDRIDEYKIKQKILTDLAFIVDDYTNIYPDISKITKEEYEKVIRGGN